MWRLFYSVGFYCLIPAIVLRLLLRSLKAPAYARRWSERFGFAQPIDTTAPVVWVHAVSVGETIAAVPMIRALQAEFPDCSYLVTNMTPTGSARARALLGDSVVHCYAPYDLPDCVARFVKRLRPGVLIVMETELWPNTIAHCARNRIPVVLANGRLSEKSARGYAKIERLIAPTLRQLSAAAIQNPVDAGRLQAPGLPQARTHVTGNIKFDLHLDEDLRQTAKALRGHITAGGQRLVWIAASTHKGEDELVLQAFVAAKSVVPELLLVLVPRHPERFDAVADLIVEKELSLSRRSAGQSISGRADAQQERSADIDVLLVDTMGELLAFYGAADIAFVGGSLVPVGGHNLIEPAAWGLPVITGPYWFNFAEVTQLLQGAGAVTIAESASAIAETVVDWARHRHELEAVGAKALAVAESNRGALARLLEILFPIIDRIRNVQPD